ncbi:hypothetical protein J3E69DRAFT_326851 [Trichoderma sp. SZMC 28015]
MIQSCASIRLGGRRNSHMMPQSKDQKPHAWPPHAPPIDSRGTSTGTQLTPRLPIRYSGTPVRRWHLTALDRALRQLSRPGTTIFRTSRRNSGTPVTA